MTMKYLEVHQHYCQDVIHISSLVRYSSNLDIRIIISFAIHVCEVERLHKGSNCATV